MRWPRPAGQLIARWRGWRRRAAARAAEKAAYDFCRRLHEEGGGPTPELRAAFERYVSLGYAASERPATAGESRPQPLRHSS